MNVSSDISRIIYCTRWRQISNNTITLYGHASRHHVDEIYPKLRAMFKVSRMWCPIEIGVLFIDI